MGLPTVTSEQRAAYFAKMRPYAEKAAKQLNIPVSVILAQWADESYYGTSALAKATGNHGGIKKVAQTVAGATDWQGYANYGGNLNLFLQDYVRVLSRDAYGYKAVRDAVSVENTVKALGLSEYAEGGYGGKTDTTAGVDLLGIIKANKLTLFDTSSPSPTPAATEKKTFSVDVPAGAGKIAVAVAIIGFGLLMLKE